MRMQLKRINKKKVIWNSLTITYCIVFIIFLATTVLSVRQVRTSKNKNIKSPVTLLIPTLGPIPTSTSIPTPTPSVIPETIIIPKLQINTEIEPVGITKEGNMDTPSNAKHVGWYQYGTIPGRVGNAVIDGHYDTVTGRAAIFYRLNMLSIGDTVEIVLSDGVKQIFIVTGKDLIPYQTFPVGYVFADKSGRNMNLITCGGIWDTKDKIYTKRVVIYTTYLAASGSNEL